MVLKASSVARCDERLYRQATGQKIRALKAILTINIGVIAVYIAQSSAATTVCYTRLLVGGRVGIRPTLDTMLNTFYKISRRVFFTYTKEEYN